MIEKGSGEKNRGILVISHGSRNGEANESVHRLVAQLKERFPTDLVEAGFLELAEPSIPEGIKSLAGQGMEELMVYPLFLFKGVHLKQDVPRVVKETLAMLGKEIPYKILEPLGVHPRVFDIVVDTLCAEVVE